MLHWMELQVFEMQLLELQSSSMWRLTSATSNN